MATKLRAKRGTKSSAKKKAPARKAHKRAPKRKPTVGRKAPRKAAKKAAAPRKKPAAVAARRNLDAEQVELLRSLKKNPHHHRLPPNKRHQVEQDEAIERDGEAGKVFVEADTEDDEAQQLGEEFVRSATSGEEAESEMEEEAQVEEQGGPFVITTARQEFGFGPDASNPPGAEREPFPRVSPAVKPKAE
jgi:hypothetical protein